MICMGGTFYISPLSDAKVYTKNTLGINIRFPSTDVIRTNSNFNTDTFKMQLPEGVRGSDGFLSKFSIPQGNPTQTEKLPCFR